jgi:hypothetical protein
VGVGPECAGLINTPLSPYSPLNRVLLVKGFTSRFAHLVAN